MILSFLALICVFYSNSFASKKASDHAPIGVMRDHVHKKGKIMTNYRFSYMKMKGLRSGNNNVQTGDALNDFMATPTEMSMRMHMIGAMYGVDDNFTLSAMSGFIEKTMNNYSSRGFEFKGEGSGIADLKLNSFYQFYKKQNNRAQINLGLSVPIGSIDEKNNSSNLPYPMQIGSGSYEFLPGLSYSGNLAKLSYGAQVNGVFRLNGNDNGYKFGDSYNLTSWIAKDLSRQISVSSRLDYNKVEAIEGLDPTLDVEMMATNNISLQDYQRLDLLFGVNFVMSKWFLQGNRFAVEIGAPIYQRIDGPMLETDYKVMVGWQNSF